MARKKIYTKVIPGFTIDDALSNRLDAVSEFSGVPKAEILRRSLTMYLPTVEPETYVETEA